MQALSDTKAIVFDIQRFSVNDGPGIRTTVFLKGCSLECSWCHNPESWSPDPEIGFVEAKCTLCNMCVEVCKFDVHTVSENKHTLDKINCDLCGQCVEVCANNALKIYGKDYSVNELLDILLKDKNYYEESNGGVTVSGGEPLQQFKFVIELFQKLKKYEIHTCLDTSGFTNETVMEHIIPWTDLFLFDYKLSKEKDYCKHSNMNKESILRNLRLLNINRKKVILRCPLIPGLNDNDEHFNSIVDLVYKNENIAQIDLIPYHRMGESKYFQIGKQRKKFKDRSEYSIPLQKIKNRLSAYLNIPINLSHDITES